MPTDREHVISVVLEHEEWMEFVRLQPQPVDWLRSQIHQLITAAQAETSDDREIQLA